MTNPLAAGPAPDPQERHTAIVLLLNKLVLAAHSRGYQEGREHIHEDDRITGADVDRLEQRIVDQVTGLLADLAAVRAKWLATQQALDAERKDAGEWVRQSVRLAGQE